MEKLDDLERWVKCVSFPNYEVSNKGRVRNIKKSKILSHFLAGRNFQARVSIGERGKKVSVARLVLEAFRPEIKYKKGCRISFIDPESRELTPDNLTYISVSDVIRKAWGSRGHKKMEPVKRYDPEISKRWKNRCPLCPGNQPIGHCWGDVNAPETI